MRTLFLLRGCPAAGKDTWIDENKLRPYTVSADDIRLMMQSPVLTTDGNLAITQKNDRYVWNMLFDILEQRMIRGDFIVVNATHYRNSLISKYKKLIQKYRYRVYVVDFTDVSYDVLIERNKSRESYKHVPEAAIEKMYKLLTLQNQPPSFAKLISKQQACDMLNSDMLYDLNNYENLVVFGDIHGCYEPLQGWFDRNSYNENTVYVFTGDYLDRGLQNKETLDFLMQFTDKSNVFFLEGNHERWLRDYAFGYISEIRSKEFIKNTLPAIKDINIRDLRGFVYRFQQMAYFKFRGKNYFICHGGIPSYPNLRISTDEYIKGVGTYEDTESLYKYWNRHKDTVVIHAHRNVEKLPVKVSDTIYNLCDTVEFGGYLRVLTVDNDGTINTYSIKNTKYRQLKEINQNKAKSSIIDSLNDSPYIIRKDFENGISSYNFSRKAFSKKHWDELTCKARGLFVNTEQHKVVMRSYDKFFNLDEVENTKVASIKTNIVYPLQVYKKENGFLAMITYYNGALMFGSKSRIDGQFVDYIKQVFSELPIHTQERVTEYLRTHDVTLVFECVNSKDNQHPIWYKYNHLYLLDIIDNTFEYNKKPYLEVIKLAVHCSLECKKHIATIENYTQFVEFKSMQDNSMQPTYEGFVFEDSDNFMFKYKTPFYRYWKYNRRYLDDIKHNRPLKYVFKDAMDVDVYSIFKSLEKNIDLTIVDIEKLYYNSFTDYKFIPVDEGEGYNA